jgi:two-component system, LytTR family, sensor kinase
MKHNLYKYALISSPILAIYGVSPFYIFDKFTTTLFIGGIIGLSLNIFFVWLLNIYLTLKYPNLESWKKIIFSYLGNFIFQLLFALLGRFSNIGSNIDKEIIDNYLTYPFITSIAFNAIILMLCNSIVNSYKKSKAEEEVQQLKLQNSEAEKQILLQQLQPHFLFNSLSVLKSLIHEKPDEAENYTVKLSEFLRYSVKAPTKIALALEDEIEFTKGYIELQKVRFENAFTFELNIPKEALQLKTPVYALQVLVENALKHNHFTEKNPLHIEIFYKDKTLTVKNNKSSIVTTEKPSGTGLSNLNQRHILITGKEIEIINGEHDFLVTLQLMPN